MPYPVNYFLSKLQNSSRNAVFENQTNLFQIIDNSNGTILDTTVDAYFLSYASGVITDFHLNSNNQLLLSDSQIFQYIGARMYYYNPRIIDSLMYSIATWGFWFDFTDLVSYMTYNSYSEIQSAISKDNWPLSMSFVRQQYTNQGGFRKLYTLNNYPFNSMLAHSTSGGYSVDYPSDYAFTSLNSPFTFFGVIKPTASSKQGDFFRSWSDDTGDIFRLRISHNAGVLQFKFYFIDSNSLSQSFQLDHTIALNSFVYFIIVSNGTDLKLYINTSPYQQQSLTVFNPNPLYSQTFLGESDEYRAFEGLVFEFGCCYEALSESNVYNIQQYFATKYFLQT